MQDDSSTRIPLGSGYFALVDFDTIPLIRNFSWWAERRHSTMYARGYLLGSGRGRTLVYMHRLIMGAPDDLTVDHINHDGLDNRRVNLRLATHSQNEQNRRGPTKLNKFGFRGVSWSKPRHRFRASVRAHGKQVHLGYFDTVEQAALAASEGRANLMTHSSENRQPIL